MHNAGDIPGKRGQGMIISTKEFFSALKDRDYLSIIFFLVFCLSLAGVFMNYLSPQDSILLLIAAVLSRLMFVYRADTIFDNLSGRLLERMDEERAKPGFRTGNLSQILEAEFPKISNTIKMKCINKLEADMDVDLNTSGDYIFYPTKVYNQPGKDRRRK
jgi:hypothetical protein